MQQEIALEFNAARVGQKYDVLIDRAVPEEKGAWIGRTYADAPDVDTVVYVTGRGLRPGQLVECEVVAAHGYDLVAAAVGKPR